MPGPSPVKRAVAISAATEDGVGADQAAVDLVEVDHVGEHRPVELDRQTAGDVTAVVGGREEGWRRARCPPSTAAAMAAATGAPGRAAAQVAHVVDGGHPVLAEGGGRLLGAVAPGPGLDGARPAGGLGWRARGRWWWGRRRPSRPAPRSFRQTCVLRSCSEIRSATRFCDSVCDSVLRLGLDDLQLLEEGDDPLVAIALVDDDLARTCAPRRRPRR